MNNDDWLKSFFFRDQISEVELKPFMDRTEKQKSLPQLSSVSVLPSDPPHSQRCLRRRSCSSPSTSLILAWSPLTPEVGRFLGLVTVRSLTSVFMTSFILMTLLMLPVRMESVSSFISFSVFLTPTYGSPIRGTLNYFTFLGTVK